MSGHSTSCVHPIYALADYSCIFAGMSGCGPPKCNHEKPLEAVQPSSSIPVLCSPSSSSQPFTPKSVILTVVSPSAHAGSTPKGKPTTYLVSDHSSPLITSIILPNKSQNSIIYPPRKRHKSENLGETILYYKHPCCFTWIKLCGILMHNESYNYHQFSIINF